MNIDHLSVIGLGLMGGSLALAVRRSLKLCKITGYDINPAALRFAIRHRLIDHPARSIPQAVRNADLTVLAVPVESARKILSRIAPSVPPHAVVTDLCSTKRTIMSAAANLPGLSRRFVGSHPMAGSAKCGIAHADGGIFRKSLCILTTGSRTDPAALRTLDRFWRTLGARTVRLAPDRHDELVALASHLPQVAASVLMAVQSPGSLAIAGAGLADTTRLAGSDGRLWAGILLDNADAVEQVIDRFEARLIELRAAVAARRRPAILRLFRAARLARERLIGRLSPGIGMDGKLPPT